MCSFFTVLNLYKKLFGSSSPVQGVTVMLAHTSSLAQDKDPRKVKTAAQLNSARKESVAVNHVAVAKTVLRDKTKVVSRSVHTIFNTSSKGTSVRVKADIYYSPNLFLILTGKQLWSNFKRTNNE